MPSASSRVRWPRPAVLSSLLALVVVAVCNGGAAAVVAQRRDRPPSVSDAPGLTGTGTPERQCVAAVSALIKLTPDSWGYGLRQGVSDSLLVAHYGADSPEVRAFRAAQAWLLRLLREEGYRNTGSQLRRVNPLLLRDCRTT